MAIEHDRLDIATESLAQWLCVIAANGYDASPNPDDYGEDDLERYAADREEQIGRAQAKIGHAVAGSMRGVARDMISFLVCIEQGEMDDVIGELDDD